MYSFLKKIQNSPCIKQHLTFSKWISSGNNVFNRREDVYIQRVQQRYADSVCKTPSEMDPECKVALITGGETGIGLAAARDLLKNGAKMVVLAGVCKGSDAMKQINNEYGEDRVCVMPRDVNHVTEFEELFYKVNSAYGAIDILFNNAGIMQDCAWELEIDTNLKSVMRGTLLGLEYMGKGVKGAKQGGGIIINHSDVAALEPFPYAPCYAATKAAIMSASQSFGAQYHYEQTGVRVVGLLSGPTDTHLLRDAADKQYKPQWGKDLATFLKQSNPQSPACVGKAVTHLVKFAASGTLWTVEDGKLFTTEIPDRIEFNTKVSQL